MVDPSGSFNCNNLKAKSSQLVILIRCTSSMTKLTLAIRICFSFGLKLHWKSQSTEVFRPQFPSSSSTLNFYPVKRLLGRSLKHQATAITTAVTLVTSSCIAFWALRECIFEIHSLTIAVLYGHKWAAKQDSSHSGIRKPSQVL